MSEQSLESAEALAAAAAATPAPVRPPNRPAHERLLESIGAKLSSKEERRKFLQVSSVR